MKYCTDCIHYRPAVAEWKTESRQMEFAKCAAELEISRINPLLDAPKYYCSTARKEDIGICGPEGRLFNKALPQPSDEPCVHGTKRGSYCALCDHTIPMDHEPMGVRHER